jgi:transglutaminase-like putative cysteine protease
MIVASLASSFATRALAQPAAAAPSAAKAPAYPDEAMVIEHADTIYTFAADGTGTEERSVVVRMQTDAAARALGIISVPYASNSQQMEFLYARVRRADGTVVETPTSDALDMPAPVTREAPLYSDLKEKQLPIRSLRADDTLEWKARITTRTPEAPNQFWGQENFIEDAVTLSQTIELRVPTGTYVNVWSPTAKAVESSSADGLHIYSWTSSHLQPTAGKQADAAAEAKKKQLWTADQELEADQGKLPTIAWTTFNSWQEVGAWYHSLEADRITPSPEVKAKAAELIAGKTTDEDKVRALYSYVATQIRYIGVDFGIGRYQPHTAAEILANQYGDCKDKHTLLAAMLSAAGIPSDAVLIGANLRFNPAMPSPAAFNHVITHVQLGGQPVWLDTTAEIAPYRMLVSVIRDRQALVVPATGAPHVDRTPADPPFVTFQTMDATGTFDGNGISHSHLTFVIRGDTELLLRNAFHSTSPGQYNQVLQQVSYGIGYAGTTSNPEISRPDDTSVPFKMSYDYQREKAGDWEHYQIIPQLAPISLPRYADSDPPVRSIDLGVPRVETSHSAMKIPDGWTATLPEAAHSKCAYASYDETYRFEKGTVYAERRIEILKQKVPTADLNTYVKWANDANLGNELYIQLGRHDAKVATDTKQGSPSTPSATTPAAADKPAPPAAASSSEDTAATTSPRKLLEQAYAASQQHDTAAMQKSLDQVKAISPEENGLWAMYGYLAMSQHKVTEAIDDLKKEISLHPDSYQVYPALLQAHSMLADHKEVLDTLRAWTAADSSNPAPPAQLMELLITDGDTTAALAVGDSAAARLPEDTLKNKPFQLAFGHAQLAAGEKKKGADTLEALLKDTEDPGMLNDAAYILSNASLDLPLAEISIRTALDKLTQESGTWTLDEDPNLLRQKSSSIAAAWDTLGWTLYREGKQQEAQSYVQPAWLNTLRGECGMHLGDILAARGSKARAMAAYELALAKSATFDGQGTRRPPGPIEQEIQRKIDALTKAGIKSTVGTEADPYRVLESMGTIKLGDEGGHTGSVSDEYRLLLRDGKVVKVEAVGAKSIAGAEDQIAKGNFGSYFPIGSHATLVRSGFINCHSNICEFVLEP